MLQFFCVANYSFCWFINEHKMNYRVDQITDPLRRTKSQMIYKLIYKYL